MKVEISHRDKVLFPDGEITKADLAGYYERVAPLMLPHLKGRPISMQRFPDGVGKHGFFNKDVPDYFPDWIDRARVKKSGGSLEQVLAKNADTLVYLANQASITPHVWLSRADEPRKPDRLVFDLDPSHENFAEVRRAARVMADLLDELGLPRFAMVTGSRGVHLWVPLRPGPDFDEVRDFARDVAKLAESREPELFTTEQRKAKRGDRILIDVQRNGYAQTVVPPYAVRARPNAPVAMPIELRELGDSKLRPDRWTVGNAFRRLARKRDPWEGLGRAAVGVAKASKRLGRLTP